MRTDTKRNKWLRHKLFAAIDAEVAAFMISVHASKVSPYLKKEIHFFLITVD